MRAAVLAASAAAAAASPQLRLQYPVAANLPQACAAITAPAPCGQKSDSEELCLAKGCCYDSSKSYPCFYGTGDAAAVSTVHVIQASHFDAGFAYTIKDVLELWWYKHFPRAMALGLALEDQAANPEGKLALHFTAQCWLIDLFYNCPKDLAPELRCPTPAEQANLTTSIQKGFLTWHAFPFNSEFELHSSDMLAAGLDVCHALDDRFGFPRKVAVSQRDVPGTTRSAIPDLLKAGVRLFSNGVNGASSPPFVPRAFRWQDPVSGGVLPTLVHPYGYGDIGFEDAVIVPGLDQAMVFAWRGDNNGPPEDVAEIQRTYDSVQKTFPGAKVVFSTFDEFSKHLLAPEVLAKLPLVTSELGDTWLHGAASDPIKVAFFRRASTLRSECIASGECEATDPAFRAFTRLLLKCGEHTWGKDIKTFLHDTQHWTNEQLQEQLAAKAPNFVDVVASWQEQRDWCTEFPIEALGGHPLAAKLKDALADIRPTSKPSLKGFTNYSADQVYNTGRWTIAFDPKSGSVGLLVDHATGTSWATPLDGSALAYGRYVTMSSQDVDDLTSGYPKGYYPLPGSPPGWYLLDFGKPNVSSAHPVHQEVEQSLKSLWLKEDKDVATFLVEATFQPSALHSYYGAPESTWLRVELSRGTVQQASASINFTYEMYGKTPTRLPEGFFVRFNTSYAQSWRVNSLSSEIDPFDVVTGGNHHHHGFADRGMTVTHQNGDRLHITSDSAAIASFGKPYPLAVPVFPNTSSISEGGGFMLMDNTWGTNYPAWVPWSTVTDDSNQRWRWTFTFETSQEQPVLV